MFFIKIDIELNEKYIENKVFLPALQLVKLLLKIFVLDVLVPNFKAA